MAAYYGQPAGRVHQSMNGGGGSRPHSILLPDGCCSFKDLAAGVDAPTCGCRRFWLNSENGANQSDDRAWCFCGHHACFHESSPALRDQNSPAIGRPAADIHRSTHQIGGGQSHPGAYAVPTWSELISEHGSPGRQSLAPAPVAASATGLGIRNSRSQAESQSINTRLWQALNGFARDQGERSNSNGIPSTAVPSIYDEPRLNSASRNNRPMNPPVSIPQAPVSEPRIDEYSATEVATPSIRGTPDLRAIAAPTAPSPMPPVHLASGQPPKAAMHVVPARSSHVQQPSHNNEPTPPLTACIGPSLSIQEMCNTIQEYGRRLDLLEGVSFSHMPSDQVQDRFGVIEDRVLDLEHWRTDQDKAEATDDTQDRLDELDTRMQDVEVWRGQQEKSRSGANPDSTQRPFNKPQRRRLPIETSSFASDGSFDENAAAQTEAIVLATLAANAETHPRIDALACRIADLENATLPSFARPWHVQVVVLPYGYQLPGVWFSATESTQNSLRNFDQISDDWTEHLSLPNTSFRSASSAGIWTTDSIEAWANETEGQWLSPKACGPSGTVFQRLASRGMVRSIVLNAPDARHICGAISHAFRDVLEGADMTVPSRLEKYHGLQERFVPLRKIRKSSRLRFLSKAEMITPATWTADFLESSVLMKVNDGERRLYLTTPEGYLQAMPGWSWPAIKDLPAYDLAGEVQQAQIAGHVVEQCWSFAEHLDHNASLGSSFASSEDSPWGTSNEGDDEETATKENTVAYSTSMTCIPRMRSLSLPDSSSAPVMEADPGPKRVASFGLDPAATNSENPHGYITKRRRISTSPELERRGVNFTPRWSREPSSPFASEDAGLARSSQSRQRGITPFAYATPHSHFDSRGGDGDTEVDAGEHDRSWEGVQDLDELGSPRGVRRKRNRDPVIMNGSDREDIVDDGLPNYGMG